MSRFDAGLSKLERRELVERLDANTFMTTYERVVTDIEHLETRAKDAFKRTAKVLVEHLWINDSATEYGMEWVSGRFADLVEIIEKSELLRQGIELAMECVDGYSEVPFYYEDMPADVEKNKKALSDFIIRVQKLLNEVE